MLSLHRRSRLPDSLCGIEPKRICLIKPSSLGDVIQALPVLSALRGRFPRAHIAWVISRAYSGLLEGHPHLDVADRAWAARELAPAAQGMRVAIHAGGRWVTKRWPTEHFAEVIRRLVDQFGLRPILVGSSEELEAAEQICSTAPNHCLNLV